MLATRAYSEESEGAKMPKGQRAGSVAAARFAALYASGVVATEAIRQAGIETRGAGSGRREAARLLRYPEVRRAVRELRAVYAEGAGVTVQRVVGELARVAFTDSEEVRKLGSGAWGAKIRALELLAEWVGVVKSRGEIEEGSALTVVYVNDWRQPALLTSGSTDPE